MKRFWAIALISTILFGIDIPISYAQSIDNCRISASKWNIVSLGFPLRGERLGKLSTANVLVVPYQLKNEPKYSISEKDKLVFENAAKDIASFSNGKLKLNLIYNSTIELAVSAEDLDEVKRGQQITWQKDFVKSTWGFTTRLLKENDKAINFKDIDAVVLYGSSKAAREEIAEAFMFTRDRHQLSNVKNDIGGNWFDPILTDEGYITNAVLLYNRLSAGFNDHTLTHELMHVVGLTDLYGSPNSPPLSLMSSAGTLALLPYEQFVLGWLPDENVTCVNQGTEISQNSLQNVFTLDYSKGSHSLIIPTSTNTALIVDVLKSDSKVTLLYYLLSNDKRPPIEIYQTHSDGLKTIDLTNFGGISSQIVSSEYRLLVSDNDGSRVTIGLIPTSIINAPESIQLIEKSIQKKSEIEAKLLAKELAEREAKSKAEAELVAKVLAERYAISDAAARAAAEKLAEAEALAELRARQEADARRVINKKTTITCVKGKLTKKVSSVKPKCPVGFKVKK
jgi:hypothetical protein